MPFFEAGITSITYPYEPDWTNHVISAVDADAASRTFTDAGYYRNLVVREVFLEYDLTELHVFLQLAGWEPKPDSLNDPSKICGWKKAGADYYDSWLAYLLETRGTLDGVKLYMGPATGWWRLSGNETELLKEETAKYRVYKEK